MVRGKASVVIPAFNEAGSIGRVLSAMPKGYEVIVVDDHSSDGTGRIAKSHGAKVIRNETNLGQCDSLMKGIKAARCGIVVTMDADGEHDPRDIPKLVKVMRKGKADMALGERQCLPRWEEKAIAWLVRRRVKGIMDATTGFRAVKKEAMQRTGFDRKAYGALTILGFAKNGMKISSVPITPKPRRIHSRTSGWKIFMALLHVAKAAAFW